MVKPYTSRSSRGRVAASVPQMTSEIATTRDGRDTTRPFVQGLQQPRDPRILGAVDWGVYDRILQDDQVYSTVQQRRTAVVSRNWNVLPGDPDDPRSVEAAEKFSDSLTRIGWDRITSKMLMAIYYGYAVAEVIWQPRDGLLDFGAIKVRHARRFRYTDKGELRLLTRTATQGEQLPPRKFWAFAAGGSDDDEMYGRGLAEWLYWPTLFKRNGLRFWNTFLDKFGSPTAIGKYRPGTPRGDIEKLLATLQAIATDSGIVVPEGMVVELLQAAKSGTADFATMCRYMDAAIAKVVLSQTMTTDDGSSKSQSETHAGVKLEVIKSDADLLSDSFNGDEGPARWWTDVNYGPDVAAPIVHRDCEEEADTKAEADTDQVLKGLGWERDDESFRETYGEGYKRVTPPDAAKLPGKDKLAPANDVDPEPGDAAIGVDGEKKTASFAANDLRALYVYRQLLNTADLLDWAKVQGFASTIAADDLHVTVTYSKTPVDWMKMGGFWGWTGDNGTHLVPPGGPRLVERFGDNAIVLVFFSGHLEQRHREMRDAGASWDHAGYYPNVTITYDGGHIDLANIDPYRGELRFGPEIFEPIVEDWQVSIREASFAAPVGPSVTVDRDVRDTEIEPDDGTDALTDRLIEEAGYRAAKALTDPILGTILTADSAEELTRLLDAAPGDERGIAQSIENASFAMRLDVEAGETDNG